MAKAYSLHIGINRVDPGHYGNAVKELKGCENDARFYSGLAEQKNCRKINMLLEADATTDNLKGCLREYAGELGSGDLFFMTYSGHGGSVNDLNRDEEDGRAMDETLCLYDRQFIDDELFFELKQFQAGVRIMMISDSCHSGTVHRHIEDDLVDLMVADEVNEMLVEEPQYIERYIPATTLNDIYNAHRAQYDSLVLETLYQPDHPFSSFMILMGACQDQETAKEFKDIESGVFTTAIKKALAERDGQPYTIRELFDAAQQHIPIKARVPGNRLIQNPNFVTFGNPEYDFTGQQLF